ncbi:MAG TPA: CidA/LrgA family protein [Candidatus Gemmiger excrementavium]|uniref:CidA/LrgA family protein n=1 Tax=Candidatus Gemmiger excrementavium TaxID=2838608 RepID=A0A9D2F4H1_9FIRM|nr:CidA/LrgA family protein [Candidatus Gemmiger excrementavium]
MKYVFQLARIVGFCLLGEVLAALLPLPLPASVYGLLLMAAALKLGVLKLDQVRETGLFLTGIFPLLFVPAASGVLELGSELLEVLLPLVIAIVPVTALVMAVTGVVAQRCAAGKEEPHG